MGEEIKMKGFMEYFKEEGGEGEREGGVEGKRVWMRKEGEGREWCWGGRVRETSGENEGDV